MKLSRTKVHPATDYALRVVNGKENVCDYVQWACQRHLKDLRRKNWPFEFSEHRANHVLEFVGHLKHYKGPFAGKAFEPLPWQVFVLANLFGWIDRKTGRRRFRRAYIEIPRKNGKTFLAGAIGLYGLFADQEEGPEIYTAATSKDQASLAYKDSRALYDACAPLHDYGKATFYDLQFPERKGVMKPVSSESKRLDGLNPHFAIFDELHAWEPVKGEALWDVFADGMGARAQPLILCITTAGFNQMGVCWKQREFVINMLRGNKGYDDDKYFGMIFTLDEGDDYRDRRMWKKANPNLGQGKEEEYLEGQVKEAEQMASRENAVKNKQFNIWTKAETKWLDVERWSKLSVDFFDDGELHGQRCFLGVDLSATRDLTATVYMFPSTRERRTLFLYPRFFIPEETLEIRARKEKIPYPDWHREGFIQATPGNVVDYDFIREDINSHKELFNIQEIGIDPWNMAAIAPKLIEDGFEVVQVRQGYASLSSPCKEFEKLILQERIHHDGNPVMNWCVENVTVDRDPADNIKPKKDTNQFFRIDGVSAAVTGLARLLEEEGQRESVYEHRGLRVIR